MGNQLYENYLLEHLKEHGFKDFKELHTYITDYIFQGSKRYYAIQDKIYRLSVIDAYRYEVRLQEIHQSGELKLDDNNKINSRKMSIDKFEETAEVFNAKLK